jgi:putative nucleotide binding protein
MSYARTGGGRDRYGDRRRSGPKVTKKYEEYAIVLDVLPADRNRRRDKYKGAPIIQALGHYWFTILEIIPEDDNTVLLQDVIALSKEDRNQIKTIIGRVPYENLTKISELQLPIAIDMILEKQAKRFLSFLNKASPISLRLHSLHLLKGVGPKSLKSILDERKILPFSTYDEFEERTKVKDIRGLLKDRIVEEITSDDIKHRLFTRSQPR